jgi:hypothetical protein
MRSAASRPKTEAAETQGSRRLNVRSMDYARRRRRNIGIKTTRPVASRTIEPGSGVAVTGGLLSPGGPLGGPSGGPFGGPLGGPFGGPLGGPFGGPFGGPSGGLFDPGPGFRIGVVPFGGPSGGGAPSDGSSKPANTPGFETGTGGAKYDGAVGSGSRWTKLS